MLPGWYIPSYATRVVYTQLCLSGPWVPARLCLSGPGECAPLLIRNVENVHRVDQECGECALFPLGLRCPLRVRVSERDIPFDKNITVLSPF